MLDQDRLPEIPQELIDHLREVYHPITNTLAYDLRAIDHRGGQISVVNYLEMIRKKQTNGNSIRTG